MSHLVRPKTVLNHLKTWDFPNITVTRNAHRQHRSKELFHSQQKVVSISWSRQDWASSPAQLEFLWFQIERKAVRILSQTALYFRFIFFFSKWGQRKIPKSFTCSQMAFTHARQRNEQTRYYDVLTRRFKYFQEMYSCEWAEIDTHLQNKKKKKKG